MFLVSQFWKKYFSNAVFSIGITAGFFLQDRLGQIFRFLTSLVVVFYVGCQNAALLGFANLTVSMCGVVFPNLKRLAGMSYSVPCRLGRGSGSHGDAGGKRSESHAVCQRRRPRRRGSVNQNADGLWLHPALGAKKTLVHLRDFASRCHSD